jgi:cobalt-zinc-cadmium efflux system protein
MHDHDHDHGKGGHHHHHAVSASDIANSAFIAGIVLNATYVVAEVVAGLYTNSVALLSDAGHNLGDVAGLALSLLSFRLAKIRSTNPSFTYGYKKTTILAALINAVILLIAIGILGYEAITRLRHPEPVQGGLVAWIAALGIFINGISALLFFRNKDHDLNTKGAYLHLMTDALVSLCVVIAGIAIHYTDWQWLDPAVSLAVLLVILISTWSLLRDSVRLSMDGVPPNIDIDEVNDIIKNIDGVEEIHHMHIWAMSTTENALTAHVVMNDKMSFDDKMQAVHNIKHELLHHDIHHATIELESAEIPCEDEDC